MQAILHIFSFIKARICLKIAFLKHMFLPRGILVQLTTQWSFLCIVFAKGAKERTSFDYLSNINDGMATTNIVLSRANNSHIVKLSLCHNIVDLLCLFKEDGGWGQWYPWQGCDVTCGNGIRVRLRTCTNPKPANGGQYCPDEPMESAICILSACAGIVLCIICVCYKSLV